MTLKELSDALSNMYSNAKKGEQVLQIYLFGIKYYDKIKPMGIKEVIIQAGLSPTYASELSKAIKIGKHVVLRKS